MAGRIEGAMGNQSKILLSALAARINFGQRDEIISALAKQPEALAIAQALGSSKLIRELRLSQKPETDESWLAVKQDNKGQVFYEGQIIGRIQILYKSSLPGELQARLAVESTIDRFLEYLQKAHQIVVLDESDRHVNIFIPNKPIPEFAILWEKFLKEVAFCNYGKSELQLPGLVQTFIVMLNTVKLADRGFAPQDFPIVTKDQADVLSAWYFAVIKDVAKRQEIRQSQIDTLKKDLEKNDLSEKERILKIKDLKVKEDMQIKEDKKYRDFNKFLKDQESKLLSLEVSEKQFENKNLPEKERKKQEKLRSEIFLSKTTIDQLLVLLEKSNGNPFDFFRLDQKLRPEKFRIIKSLSKNFDRIATDQINSTTGANFTKCFSEMYRLIESQVSAPSPKPLLTEKPILSSLRLPGDSSREFCYACGNLLNPEDGEWKVARFMFERPSQRRQSSSSEGRPHICNSCSALAFASPLKVTEESIILRLDPGDFSTVFEIKIKDYLRMLTNKEMHLSSGRYLVLASERTSGGDLASQKLGQVQYALAKVASIFPGEVLTDFKFSLIIQGSQISLLSRHLLFIKGLMDCYRQSIVISGKDINMTLGEAVRYVQQDLPFLANYILIKNSSFSSDLKLEQIRILYWNALKQDLQQQGDSMNSDNQLSKRAKLYRDVAALTGLTYAFAQFLESTAKSLMKQEDAEREVSKLIEKVDDAISFCYYATLGDEKKTSVQARLYHNPDCDFIYSQTKALFADLGISDRENKDEKGKSYLQFYADDISRTYQYFATKDYAQEKDWKELTYNLKLSLYTRFPELVRKLKSTSEKK